MESEKEKTNMTDRKGRKEMQSGKERVREKVRKQAKR